MPASPVSPPAARPRLATERLRPATALVLVLCAQLMVILDMTVVNVALPRVETGLHFSATSLSWVLDAYSLAFGGLLLLGGRAGDIVGRRRVFLTGIGVFTLASLAAGPRSRPRVTRAHPSGCKTPGGRSCTRKSPAASSSSAGAN